jgi:glucokinase
MKYSIGVDVGGTAIKYGLVNNMGEILIEKIKPTYAVDSLPKMQNRNSPKTILENIKSCIKELLLYAAENKMYVAGIGIGVPGLVDQGEIMGSVNIPELNNLILLDALQPYFDLPLQVENDANCMGFAEIYFGKDPSIRDLVFLTIGTGIGGALVLNGELYSGYRNRGTELGHISIDINGPNCSCGAKGCLEAVASIPALIKDYESIIDRNMAVKENLYSDQKKIDNLGLDGKILISRYLKGEKEAILAMNNHFHYLSVGITSLINIFSPQKVILGGGITEAGKFYVHEIQKRVKIIAMKETSEFTQIETAKWGNKAGFIGASALIFRKYVDQ